jgi:hypothetical protein
MIIACRWRHDGEFSSVLFVGDQPVAEVARIPGKAAFRCTLNGDVGIVRLRFADRAAAMKHAELTFDARARSLLTQAVRDVLTAAGL